LFQKSGANEPIVPLCIEAVAGCFEGQITGGERCRRPWQMMFRQDRRQRDMQAQIC
jgi:hypothetical protein